MERNRHVFAKGQNIGFASCVNDLNKLSQQSVVIAGESTNRLVLSLHRLDNVPLQSVRAKTTSSSKTAAQDSLRRGISRSIDYGLTPRLTTLCREKSASISGRWPQGSTETSVF
jgi:hypothetical protein